MNACRKWLCNFQKKWCIGNFPRWDLNHIQVTFVNLKKIECEQLHKFLLELSKEEQWLIQELYFEERTEREVASVLGLSQKAINKRRQKILEKLRKLF